MSTFIYLNFHIFLLVASPNFMQRKIKIFLFNMVYFFIFLKKSKNTIFICYQYYKN